MNSVKTAKGTELPLLNLKGKAYLQVQHRLVWFREERPTWSIETSFESLHEKGAIARAVIRDDQGRTIATGHKSETPQGFADYIEKAETGAIGRALALCGYGTQFTDDLEEGDRIVDSPVSTKNGPRPIVGEQPAPQDGVEPTDYRIPFGKYAQRSIEEVFDQFGERAVVDYIKYLEDTNAKKGQKPSPPVQEFIDRASHFMAAMEQSWANEAGSRG